MGNFRAYLIIRTIYISAIVSILKIMNSATVTASTSVCYHIKNVLFKWILSFSFSYHALFDTAEQLVAWELDSFPITQS